jgi:hypothetical protein
MKIVVTQEHIDKGKIDHRCLCPIALAFSDAGLGDVTVSLNNAYTRTTLWILPLEARLFVEEFDSGVEVKPFSFELEVV